MPGGSRKSGLWACDSGAESARFLGVTPSWGGCGGPQRSGALVIDRFRTEAVVTEPAAVPTSSPTSELLRD